MRKASAHGKSSGWKKNWLGRLGMVGFIFFLVKGLIWLAVFFGLFRAFS